MFTTSGTDPFHEIFVFVVLSIVKNSLPTSPAYGIYIYVYIFHICAFIKRELKLTRKLLKPKVLRE